MNVSFIHRGGPGMASYRYRVAMPAKETGWAINDPSADVLIFSKPHPLEMPLVEGCKLAVVDFCDDHFDWPHYREFLKAADAVTCCTPVLAETINKLGRQATVIPEPYEFPEVLPHCRGNKVLWQGHAVNGASLRRVLPDLAGIPIRVVSNIPGAIPWSRESVTSELFEADIFILPATAAYKSPNRAVEAIRMGCFVVAEPHPSIMNIPGIWIGNIREGIEWAAKNLEAANERTRAAQSYVKSNFSPERVGNAWKNFLASCSTSDAAARNGTDG